MKVIDGYILKEIASNYMVIPVGQSIIEYKSMLHLNDTGAFIWQQLESDIQYDQLLQIMISEYEAVGDDIAIIKKDLDEFIDILNSMKLITD